MSNQYAPRDTEALGDHYLRHVSAMTVEKLQDKSAIAAELAWRDAEIARLGDRLSREAMSNDSTGLHLSRVTAERDAYAAFLGRIGWTEEYAREVLADKDPFVSGEEMLPELADVLPHLTRIIGCEHWEARCKAVAERDRLTAVLAHLPRLADGEIALSEMQVWIGGTTLGDDIKADRGPYTVGTVVADHLWASSSTQEPNEPWPLSGCYSTAAARDAAWPATVEEE